MNKYPSKVKAEVISVLRQQLVEDVEPGDSYQRLIDTYGVTRNTIYQWKYDLKKQMQIGSSPKRSGAEKLSMVIRSATMNELELGEFLRSNGVTKEELASWKKSFEDTDDRPVRSVEPQSQKEAKKTIARLERELKRKEKALAETAAILVLRGKADAIWGAEEVE